MPFTSQPAIPRPGQLRRLRIQPAGSKVLKHACVAGKEFSYLQSTKKAAELRSMYVRILWALEALIFHIINPDREDECDREVRRLEWKQERIRISQPINLQTRTH